MRRHETWFGKNVEVVLQNENKTYFRENKYSKQSARNIETNSPDL